MTDPIWFRIEGLCDNPDSVAASLWAIGAAGVEIQDHVTFMEGGTIPPVPEGKVRVISFFESQSDTWAPPEITGFNDYRWERFDDRSWETAWMAYFKPNLLCPRIIVGPPWEEFEAPEGGHKIVIEPGMAFGTGTHETTQLCSQALDNYFSDQREVDVLDVGCGSGILSIIARKLGASTIYGIDLTEDVVEIARTNAALNNVDQVSFETKPLSEVPNTYPLVVANILAHILESNSEALIAHTEIGGRLIMCGLTADQEGGFCNTFSVPELTLEGRSQLGEWVCLEYVRVK